MILVTLLLFMGLITMIIPRVLQQPRSQPRQSITGIKQMLMIAPNAVASTRAEFHPQNQSNPFRSAACSPNPAGCPVIVLCVNGVECKCFIETGSECIICKAKIISKL